MQLEVLNTTEPETKLTGIVISVLDAKSDGERHSAIFRIKAGQEKHRVVCRFGTIEGLPLIDDIWTVVGEHQDDLKYGSQFIAISGKRQSIDLTTDQVLICDYIQQNRAFYGIGKEWVRKLNKAFPHTLSETLETAEAFIFTNHPKLKMPETLAKSLIMGWRHCSVEMKLLEFLGKKNIPHKLAHKLMTFWGNTAIDSLEADPYCLLSLMPTKNALEQWREIDQIARKNFNVTKGDPRRALAAIEACLYEAYDTGGHMAQPIATVQRVLGDLGIELTVYDIVQQHGQFALVVHRKLGLVQSVGHLALEKFTNQRLNEIAQSSDSFPLAYHEKLLHEYEKQACIDKTLDKFKLDKSQVEAVKFVTGSKLSQITGGGGTGKTTIISAIVHQHEARNRPVWLLAPTGKAARRLAEETGHKTETVFSFILQMGERIRANKLEHSLFIIDEASMLDMPSMYSLLKRMPSSCRLCLVGDVKQLEPVGAGLVFHQLAVDNNLCVVLERPYRQKCFSDLNQFCDAIGKQDLVAANQHLAPYRDDYLPDVTWQQPPSGSLSEMVRAALRVWYDFSKSGKEPQLLAATRKACGLINQERQKVRTFRKKLPARNIHGRHFIVGDPVIYEQNNRDLAISNGSVGVITEIYPDPLLIDGRPCIVKIEFLEEGTKLLTETECIFMDLAYCITTHKSQGSQYDDVIVILDEGFLIDNSWLYTAATRARHKVVLVGNLDLIQEVISSPPKATRRYIGSPILISKVQNERS
ncbi:putative ATP-dependent exoDNAse (exonuclease V), alpha subunit [Vibrio mediterranei AK1]|uniref:AAA family ATPase n=1 Tax=Vibrio mediterranei TaxID=689 RepID=UPI0001540EF8|nr:AAA family ATPase [Vibrio mediterranei]EDL54003.1 putative ATP-dependent exoDNAse (exonuclease V), alpha subunit [Vibrio mediterranei AK1]